MTAVEGLLTAYLERLERATADLPEERREELLAGIREHLAAARAVGAAHDEASARTVLDRLGTPEEIAGAAREDAGPGGGAGTPWSTSPRTPWPPGGPWPPQGPTVVQRAPSTGIELAAVVLLTVGALVPVLGWLAGVALLWSSRRWRLREKLLGTFVVPLGPGAALLLGALGPFDRSETCTSAPVPAPGPGPAPLEDAAWTCTTTGPSGWAIAGVLAVLVIAPVVVGALLLRLARRRAAAEPPVLVPVWDAASGSWGALEISAVLVLGLGGLLVPVVGSLVGVLLVCCSPRWTVREKAVAAALALLPVLALLPLLIARTTL